MNTNGNSRFLSYKSPKIEQIEVDTAQMLCVSPSPNQLNFNTGATWEMGTEIEW